MIAAASTRAGITTRRTNIQDHRFRSTNLFVLVQVSRDLGTATKREENVQSNYLTGQDQPLLHEPWSFSGSQKVNGPIILI